MYWLSNIYCQQCAIPGCTDPTAFNYDSLANVDDGSCIPVLGCTDVNALNFDAAQTLTMGLVTNPSPVSGISCSSGLQSFVFSDNLDVNNGWTGDISTAAGDWDFPTSFLEVIQLLQVLLVLLLEQEQLGQNMKLQVLKTER